MLSKALATNKLQACVGSFVSAAHYYHQGLVDMRESRTLMLIATFFGAVGAILVQFIEIVLLSKLLPFVMIAAGRYALLSTQLLIGEFLESPVAILPINTFML
ncbi:TSUP family transporter [Helicobacter apodemus]|uniref:TSUP family transporter n=1 Tax=Helicobacter apodemus TaxID=135569 RepID=UPI001EF3B1C6|nr:TSUP family transporter [Helicobacter apodemus]